MSTPKCRKEAKHACFTLQTDIDESPQTCYVDTDKPGVQEITVVSYKGYPVYLELEAESLNRCVEFVNTGNHEDRTTRRIPPAEVGNPAEKTFRFRVVGVDDSVDGEDSIRVNARYYTREDAPDDLKNDSIPEVYPEVDLA